MDPQSQPQPSSEQSQQSDNPRIQQPLEAPTRQAKKLNISQSQKEKSKKEKIEQKKKKKQKMKQQKGMKEKQEMKEQRVPLQMKKGLGEKDINLQLLDQIVKSLQNKIVRSYQKITKVKQSVQKQKQYREFLRYCLYKSFNENRFCQSVNNKKKYLIICKMFEYIFVKLLEKGQTYFSAFKLQDNDLELAFRWTIICQSFQDFYESVYLEDLDQNQDQYVTDLTIDNIQTNFFKLRTLQAAPSKLCQQENAKLKEQLQHLISRIKESYFMAHVYSKFILKTRDIKIDQEQIMKANKNTKFYFVDYPNIQLNGLTTHNSQFFSFINMHQIVKGKIKNNDNFVNAAKAYVFVVVVHELVHSLLRKLNIVDLKAFDDSACQVDFLEYEFEVSVSSRRQVGYLFQRFFFGDVVQIVSENDCCKIEQMLTLNKEQMVGFEFQQNAYPFRKFGQYGDKATQKKTQQNGQSLRSNLGGAATQIAYSYQKILSKTPFGPPIERLILDKKTMFAYASEEKQDDHHEDNKVHKLNVKEQTQTKSEDINKLKQLAKSFQLIGKRRQNYEQHCQDYRFILRRRGLRGKSRNRRIRIIVQKKEKEKAQQ